jgi:hypothetical protein
VISGNVRAAFAPSLASPGCRSGFPARTSSSQPNVITLFAPRIEMHSHRNSLFAKVSAAHPETSGDPPGLQQRLGTSAHHSPESVHYGRRWLFHSCLWVNLSLPGLAIQAPRRITQSAPNL